MGDPDILWFRLSDTKAIKLDTTEVTQQKFCLDGEVSKGFASLQIYNTNHNDSGIYYCGVSFLTKDPTDKSKQTGGGTILVIRAHGEIISGEEKLLQSVLITILGLYSLCITVLLKQTINWTRKTKLSAKKRVERASKVSLNKHTDFQRTKCFHALTVEFNNKYKNQEAACEHGENDGTLYENTDQIYENE
ncbi:immunoglobulin superfamily member 6 [Callorhinchus milii]|uniref:immunoglobulin superfamily member 6 n=1 Tax=Callorhinchus milii TaxID=7868 RepID=UPI000457135B|nr:immunoglobulin superfamily member 6 [Callorhinchus milii]|eukprot:gi/632952297/ref/XP_007891774.1/ PREDICTED: immunoglobulin superfamily member 6 [Callorhinchus milii]